MNIIIDDVWYAGHDGLHAFNLSKGNGWDLEVGTLTTGNRGGVAAAQAVSVAAAVLLGVYTSPNVQLTYYYDLTSNPCFIEDKVFTAGNRELAGADSETGKELWRKGLPRTAGHSYLYETSDGNLGMLAEARCYKNHYPADYGEPFFATFDINTGDTLMFQPIDSEYGIKDYALMEEENVILTSYDIHTFDKNYKPLRKVKLGRAEQKATETQKAKKANFLQNFLDPEDVAGYFFTDKQGEFHSLISKQNDSTKVWILGSGGILQMSDTLKVQNWYSNSKLYKVVAEKDSICILEPLASTPEKGKTDNEQKVVLKVIKEAENMEFLGEYKFMGDYIFHDGRFYIWHKESLSIVPISKS
jgi:hypothetical protein